jgi:hypothetical protein
MITGDFADAMYWLVRLPTVELKLSVYEVMVWAGSKRAPATQGINIKNALKTGRESRRGMSIPLASKPCTE